MSLYLKFSLRGEEDQRTEEQLLIHAEKVWQEGPDDLHVHLFQGTPRDNIDGSHFPAFDGSDYILPDLVNPQKTMKAYCLEFVTTKISTKKKNVTVATPAYVARLRYFWLSPNGITAAKKGWVRWVK